MIDLAHPERWHGMGHWLRMTAATAHLEAPLAALSVEALAWNAHDMRRRAAGTPIRVATKSVRSRDVLRSVLALDGYAGLLAYTLPEALWLADDFDDIVVAYPTVDRAAIAALAADATAAGRVTLMVDSVDHLDCIDEVVAPSARATIRVAIDLDASWMALPGWMGAASHIGVRRSPVHSARQARALAERILERPGFRLAGIMSYEAHIAGLGDAPAGGVQARAKGAAIRAMQRRSMRELIERRGEAVRLVREIADLDFVNGGGTGSLEATASDPAVTDIAAGSGLFGPHLFDTYRHFAPAPALGFALSVTRRPAPGIATLLGGGWIASGASGPDRSPRIAWPTGLTLTPREGAGEVQTPVTGRTADALRVGDRVWLRHTKAGELGEHVRELHVVEGESVVGTVPTYRGEGKAFL